MHGGRQRRTRCSVPQDDTFALVASARVSSGRGDDDLAESVALADVGERHGYLVESERAVDVDADLACEAQVGERLKLGWTLSHGEDADPASGEPAGDPAQLSGCAAAR